MKQLMMLIAAAGAMLGAQAASFSGEWYEYWNDNSVSLGFWGDFYLGSQLAIPVNGVAAGEKIAPVVTCGSMPAESIVGTTVMTDQEMFDAVVKPILAKKSEWDYNEYDNVYEYGREYEFDKDIWPSLKVIPDRQWIIVKTQKMPTLTGRKTLAVGVKGTDCFVTLDIPVVQEAIKPDIFFNRVTFPSYNFDDEWDHEFYSQWDQGDMYVAGDPAVPELQFLADSFKVSFPEAGTFVMTAGPNIEKYNLSITGNSIISDVVQGGQQWDVTGTADYRQDWFWACGMTSLFRCVRVSTATTLTFSTEDGFYPRRMLFYPASAKSVGVTGIFGESEGGRVEHSSEGWVKSNGIAQGYVKGSGTYKVGETVSLTAVASPDYAFDHWELEYGSLPAGTDLSKSTLSFKVTDEVAGSADERRQIVVWARWRRLSIVMGLALPQGCGSVSGNGAYKVGGTATLVATPEKGYDFVKWSDEVMDRTRTVAVGEADEKHVIYAYFALNGESTSDESSDGGVSGSVDDVSFSKAQTKTGALYDAKGNCVGTVELKFGKKGKKGVKLSASATMIIGGKPKKISAKAVTLADGETRNTLAFKDPIGEMTFEMGADGVFTLKSAKYEMVGLKEVGGTVQEVKVGGSLPNGTLYFNLVDGSMPNFGKDGALLEEALPNGEPVHVKGGKWSCDKAASLKYKKDKKTGVYALDGMNDPKKPNKSGLKLSYTAKTGVFKGSFKMYATTEGAKPKLKKFTVNVTGLVVNGKGNGEATLKKLAASWTVTVE